jgi:hypothetical protein
VLAQETIQDNRLIQHYRARGAEPVICDGPKLRDQGYEVMLAALQGSQPTASLRHDSRSLAHAVMRFYRKIKGN